MKLLKPRVIVAVMALSAALVSAQDKQAELKVGIAAIASGAASVTGVQAKVGWLNVDMNTPRRVSPGFWTTLMKLAGKKILMVHLPLERTLERTLPELVKGLLIRSLSAGAVRR